MSYRVWKRYITQGLSNKLRFILSLNFLCFYFFWVCKIITGTNLKQATDKSYFEDFDMGDNYGRLKPAEQWWWIDKEVDRIIIFSQHQLCSDKLGNIYLNIISRCNFRLILPTKKILGFIISNTLLPSGNNLAPRLSLEFCPILTSVRFSTSLCIICQKIQRESE